MSIAATCANCLQRYDVDDQQAGKRVHCPNCRQAFTVPEPGTKAAPPEVPTTAPPAEEVLEATEYEKSENSAMEAVLEGLSPAATSGTRLSPFQEKARSRGGWPAAGNRAGHNGLVWLVGGAFAGLALIVVASAVIGWILQAGSP